MNKIARFLPRVAAVATAAVAAPAAFAAGPDFSTLTASIDFSTAVTAILGIGAALAIAYIAMKGVRLVLGALRSA